MNRTHLTALEARLHNENGYLAAAKSDGERALRKVWIAQIEREIAREREFLGLGEEVAIKLTDDELLAELAA